MADMGLDFAPPKMSDAKGWDAVAKLYEVGETFHSCGCGGPGYRPRDPARLEAFFAERARDYAEHLDGWLTTSPRSATQRAERSAAIAAWGARITKLKVAGGRARRRGPGA
jgi:hypothetical protein